jgi:hypothetical protein
VNEETAWRLYWSSYCECPDFEQDFEPLVLQDRNCFVTVIARQPVQSAVLKFHARRLIGLATISDTAQARHMDAHSRRVPNEPRRDFW